MYVFLKHCQSKNTPAPNGELPPNENTSPIFPRHQEQKLPFWVNVDSEKDCGVYA